MSYQTVEIAGRTYIVVRDEKRNRLLSEILKRLERINAKLARSE